MAATEISNFLELEQFEQFIHLPLYYSRAARAAKGHQTPELFKLS